MPRNPTPVNIRNFSVRCGRCEAYPALTTYQPGEEQNTYRFECDPHEDGTECAPILLEIPVELDEFANRDPGWRGGKKHAGADMDEDAAEATSTEERVDDAAAESAPQSGGLLPVIG